MEPLAAPVPMDEPERLQDLRELGLADEPELLPLRGLPTLAAEACDRPWAGVTLVEEDEHRFLAAQGPFSSSSPREVAPCAYAIAEDVEVFEVRDFEQQPPFQRNPLVEDPGVRFYAGAPIRSHRGHGLGTVCVFDERPGELEPAEREALVSLSEVLSLHLQLAHRTEELEAANEELDQFTTFVSHELTDPLSQVVSNLDLLEMDLADAEPETRELVDEAQAGAERMRRLIQDLLRYGRAGDRELDREPVALQRLAEQARAELEHRLRPGSEIEIGDLPRVYADETLFRRVIANLVKNAIEHGGEPVRVRIDAEETDREWRTWVEDDGQGVPPAMQEDLFELFATGSAEESTGVGLALCKRIVERHGGEIEVDSEPGEGSRFLIRLPKVRERG